jgi:phage gpG-like protein
MKEVQGFGDYIAPAVIGVEAVNFYRESFHNEGFTDKTLEKWEALKNPPKRKGKANSKSFVSRTGRKVEYDSNHRKILVDTGNLSRSLKRDVEKGRVTVQAEAFSKKGFNYAPVHNWGDEKINVPQRQFVGPSQTLDKRIREELQKEVNRILRK